tara:strand:+ start:1142 stop:1816 length:675 start_codon:yes stop_codon:yes gene_type:complete
MNSKKSTNFNNDNPLWDFWIPLFFTLFLYFGIRVYVAEARYIPSGSMLPGLQIKDRLIIEKLSFRRRQPRRGEIVVFNSPFIFDSILNPERQANPMKCFLLSLPVVSTFAGTVEPKCDAYIKRVIAIGGDQITINQKGYAFVNGLRLNEPYVKKYCSLERSERIECPAVSKVIPEGYVFVLGDNRRNSWDSRYWPADGLLPVRHILGRAVWRFWPANRIGPLSL